MRDLEAALNGSICIAIEVVTLPSIIPLPFLFSYFFCCLPFPIPLPPSLFQLTFKCRSGLVYQAFSYCIRSFLQFIRACILNLAPTQIAPSTHDAPALSLLTLHAHARAIGRQLTFVWAVCENAGVKRGAQLLSYLYECVVTGSHSVWEQGIFRFFLQHVSLPYLNFVYEWMYLLFLPDFLSFFDMHIYFGRIADPFEEFIVSVSPNIRELAEKPDVQFWNEGYKVLYIFKYYVVHPSQARESEYIPKYLRNLLHPIHYCGKALHILRLTEQSNLQVSICILLSC